MLWESYLYFGTESKPFITQGSIPKLVTYDLQTSLIS